MAPNMRYCWYDKAQSTHLLEIMKAPREGADASVEFEASYTVAYYTQASKKKPGLIAS